MGDFSYVQHQEIKVLDGEKLRKFKDDGYGKAITNDGEIDFAEMESQKIEGYYYEEFVDFLNNIAPYLKGFVEFSCDYGYNFRIVFEKGKAYRVQARTSYPREDMEEITQKWARN